MATLASTQPFQRSIWANCWKAKYRQDAMGQVLRELFYDNESTEDNCVKAPASLGTEKLRKLFAGG